jgi:peroxiredoxin
MTLKPGDTAPSITLRSTAGQTVSLRGDRQDERDTLLIFLRHLG